MQKKFKKSLFIFKRDLRSYDNTGLNLALKESEKIITCFIFDPRQIEKNEYKGSNSIQFLVESLEDLKKELDTKNGKLYFFYGKHEEVIEKFILKEKIDAVYTNRDFTPFSKKRDLKIEQVCKNNSVSFVNTDDILLNSPEIIIEQKSKPYTVFTPFYKFASTLLIKETNKLAVGEFFIQPLDYEVKTAPERFLEKTNTNISCHGKRKNALNILENINSFASYDETRNNPSKDSTTHLSAYLKFGLCSPREVFYSIKNILGESHSMLRQLYWRDFFYHIAHFFPHVFGNPFNKKYDFIKWNDNKKTFELWCNGETGFPIVDAGMRELNATGYMHNRVRMITASFLIKDLHIDWRWGEKYFAQKLVDYDPAINNGNWQWVASTGCDAQPYFRIFNPWLQQEKFDSECLYIKKWIPELERIDSLKIHHLYKNPSHKIKNYPHPIVDHSAQAKITKELYSQAISEYLDS